MIIGRLLAVPLSLKKRGVRLPSRREVSQTNCPNAKQTRGVSIIAELQGVEINHFSRFSNISFVIRVRSYSCAQPQSARATESSILCGQLSAMD